MGEWFRARTPRVLLRRESLWTYAVPASASQYQVLDDRTAKLVFAGYVAYSDAQTIAEFEDSLLPLVATFRESRSHLAAAFVSRFGTFESALLREMLERCAGQAVATVVEIRGPWTEAALEVLASTRPSYLRIGPEFVQGVATLPEQFRRLVQLAEFSHCNGMPLVARGVSTPEDLQALRVAGVGSFHQAESGDPNHDEVDEMIDPVRSDRQPIVLPFPLRPVR